VFILRELHTTFPCTPIVTKSASGKHPKRTNRHTSGSSFSAKLSAELPPNWAGPSHPERKVHTLFTADFLSRREIAFPTSEVEVNCRFIRIERLWQLGPPGRVKILATIDKAKSYCNAVAFVHGLAGKSPDSSASKRYKYYSAAVKS
jgi:hypothetical protein